MSWIQKTELVVRLVIGPTKHSVTMETERSSETFDLCPDLTLLAALEDFINK